MRTITHPVVLVALGVLALNDRVGKARWPGPVTGIASDVAGLMVLPIVLAVVIEALARRPLGWRGTAALAAVVAAGFAAVELVPLAEQAYEQGLGVLGWPVRVLAGGGSTRVVATADPADLLALPCALAGPLLWRRAERPASAARTEQLVGVL